MKYLIVITLLFTFNLSFGQVKDPWKGKPNSIEDSFLCLDRMFGDTAKYTFATLPEDISTFRLHHGFGTWIRNNWGLWGSSKLKQELTGLGFVHPDDMSSFLLKAYHRRLNNKPLQIEEEAKAYQAYWNKAGREGFSAGDLGNDHTKRTTNQELLDYFPVGDTIVVNLYATHKKLFQNYASSVEGIAVIKSHNTEKLNIRLLSVKQKEKHLPEHKAGQEFEISPISCSLIPPKGWNVKK
ncbi:DUF6794 domain-containing protein [Rufibacter sediminis]|uniref:DUF6794 domain-containing protein n=1 Tax=Rufibacter sediminis TaxID=2762756 RepID=A0ABR6VQ61_9BACT|nr:DUF6794 domain-containing protein [Rufibacter sediminis]MBC3539323.1 hypothetical protein [Rufibacter sediminis]